ncbi:hypothetical protein BGZ57DRAFT_915249 [Hyaloscypha finlandica]|nr:hypothetical protein BGZ57DRAFT_915249 [Hyaloscypha finlandica]
MQLICESTMCLPLRLLLSVVIFSASSVCRSPTPQIHFTLTSNSSWAINSLHRRYTIMSEASLAIELEVVPTLPSKAPLTGFLDLNRA